MLFFAQHMTDQISDTETSVSPEHTHRATAERRNKKDASRLDAARSH